MTDVRYRPASRSAPEAIPAPRSRRRLPRRDPWWARLFVIFGAVLMLASGGTIIVSRYVFARVGGQVQEANLLGSGARKDNSGRAGIEGPLNVMLLGSDYREGTDLGNTDTILVLHIPRTHDQAYLVSFQRDTRVAIPRCGTDKINSAYFCGGQGEKGIQRIAETLTKLTQLQGLDAAALINFSGFTGVVRELGGVRMYIEKDITSIHPPHRKFKKGWHELDADAALDYVRQRYQFDDGDFARMRHQQQFLKAIMKRAVEKGYMYDPIKLDRLIKIGGKALFLDLNGVAVEQYVFSLRNIRPEHLTAITVPVAARDIDGTSFQELTDESEDLFKALREETVADWAINHPTWVNGTLDGGP